MPQYASSGILSLQSHQVSPCRWLRTTTDVPIGDDFTFSFIWDWQNEQAFFDGMPVVAGNLGGLETINIDRQNDDWFTINSFWYRFNYSFNKFFYSGNDSNYLIVISGKCEEYSVFLY